MDVKIELLPDGRQYGTFQLAGRTWKTKPGKVTGEEILQTALKLEREYYKLIELKRKGKLHE